MEIMKKGKKKFSQLLLNEKKKKKRVEAKLPAR